MLNTAKTPKSPIDHNCHPSTKSFTFFHTVEKRKTKGLALERWSLNIIMTSSISDGFPAFQSIITSCYKYIKMTLLLQCNCKRQNGKQLKLFLKKGEIIIK